MSSYFHEVRAKAAQAAAIAEGLAIVAKRTLIASYSMSPLKKYFYGPEGQRVATFSNPIDAKAYALLNAVADDLWRVYEMGKNSAQGCPMSQTSMRHQVYCPNCELARRIEKLEKAIEKHLTTRTMRYQK